MKVILFQQLIRREEREKKDEKKNPKKPSHWLACRSMFPVVNQPGHGGLAAAGRSRISPGTHQG